MAINLASKYESKVAERFSLKSITDAYAGHDYTFEGVNAINIYSVDVPTLNTYSRTASSQRFGTPAELGDTIQTMTMADDKSFTYIIDKGNAAEQYNVKQSNKSLQRTIDEVVTPYVDKYRLNKWASAAGSTVSSGWTTSTTGDDILEDIFDSEATMSNLLVPMEGRVLFIDQIYYNKLLLAGKIVGVDTLGNKTITNGTTGKIGNSTVVPVPTSYFSTVSSKQVLAILKYKNCTVDPFKLKDYRIHTDPPGISGALVEGRFIQDAFVKTAQKDGLLVLTA